MPFQINRAWMEFMETPISSLEEFGLELRTINVLEGQFGIYVKCITGIETEDLCRRVPQMGNVQRLQLQRSLRECFEAIKEKNHDGF